MNNSFRPHLWLIELIGVIVPRRLRADWRQEWEAELRYRETLLAEWDRLDWRNKLDLLRRSLGAFWDALLLQPRRLEDEMFQDLRYGVRMLRKNPGFSLVAILTLALGIGANTAIFSLIDKLMLQTLPVHNSAALVELTSESISLPGINFGFAWADFLDYRARNAVFTDLTAHKIAKVILGVGDQIEHVRAELVAENYFAMFGVRPLLGRTFTRDENRAPGAHPLAILSFSLWQSRFGGAANVIGQSVVLNAKPYTIIGVMPASFRGVAIAEPIEVWVPAMMLAHITRQNATDDPLANRDGTDWYLAGRLKPGLTRAAAEAAMDTLARQVRDAWMPERDRQRQFNERRLQLVSLAKGISGVGDDQEQLLKFLFAIVGVVLLIACANLAGLLVARAAARRKEFAVRLALGAGRGRLLRQLLTESLLLSGLGGMLSFAVAPWFIQTLLSFLVDDDMQLDIALNGRVAAFSVGLSLLTGVFFGLLPAWQASKPDLIPALKDDALLRANGRGFVWSRRSLIAAQVALSVAVLICAGLLVRTLRHYLMIDPGFNPQNVLVAALELPEEKYDEARAGQFFQQLRERLQSLPGVQSIALADTTPLSGTGGQATVMVEGQQVTPNALPLVDSNVVSAGYHALLEIPVEQGRSFTEADRKGQPEVVTINTAFAQKFFPNQNPIGRRLRFSVNKPWRMIVGVTRDIKSMSLAGEPRPQVETPVAQQNAQMEQRVLLRTSGDAALLLPQVRREVRAFDAELSLFKATTLAGDLRAHLGVQRIAAMLTGVFGLVALLLTAIGLYGVVAYTAHQRTREIGIRMALGAQAPDVLRLVLRESAWLIFTGLLAGLVAGFAVARLISTQLYGIRPHDPLTFIAVALLLAAAALLACWLPARRATKTDPMIALRTE